MRCPVTIESNGRVGGELHLGHEAAYRDAVASTYEYRISADLFHAMQRVALIAQLDRPDVADLRVKQQCVLVSTVPVELRDEPWQHEGYHASADPGPERRSFLTFQCIEQSDVHRAQSAVLHLMLAGQAFGTRALGQREERYPEQMHVRLHYQELHAALGAAMVTGPGQKLPTELDAPDAVDQEQGRSVLRLAARDSKLL